MIIFGNRFRWLGLMIAAALTGCLSPHENFYALDVNRPPQATENRAMTIVVGPVTLPQMVDRPQLVLRDGSYKITVLEQERWATPLKESFPRLIADELNQHVSDRRFVPGESHAVLAPAGRLILDVSRFDATMNVGARVTAHWVYRLVDTDGTASAPIEGDADVQTKISQPGYEGLVQAVQQTSLALADEIATHLIAGK